MSRKFTVIVVDSPWAYENHLRGKKSKGIKRSADSHYDVMPLEDIMSLPVGDIAAENSVLALWVPNSLIFSHGFPTLEAWGFTYKQKFTWVKISKKGTPRPGMGRMFEMRMKLR